MRTTLLRAIVSEAPVSAQKAELTPFLGGQTKGSLDLLTAVFRRIDVQNEMNSGLGASYLLSERSSIEFRCRKKNSYYFQEWLPAPGLRGDLHVSTKPPAFAQRAKEFVGKFLRFLVIFLTLWTPLLVAQERTAANPKKPGSGPIDYLLNYLNMAGTKKSNEFLPMTQAERNRLYFKTMVNPLGFAKSGLSAGLDQADDKPREWEQGASGYGKRFANILGQNSIQRTVSYGLGSALHEDTRYFNSGRQGFWSRTGYALTSGVLARHDDGSRHFSFSQVGGVAAGAFLARVWLPPSQSSAGAGAVSFGITMGSNAAFGIVKEFLPDLGRALAKKHKKSATAPYGIDAKALQEQIPHERRTEMQSKERVAAP